MPSLHSPRTAIALIAAAGTVGLAFTGVGVAAAASAKPARFAVPNAQPKLAGATRTGKASSGQTIEVKLYLADRNAAQLSAAIKAVTTPGSPSYGKYLSAAQFRTSYAPSSASVDAVRSFLAAGGLKVTTVPANHAYVTATGTVAKVEKAFATTLATYKVGGSTLRAASKAPTVPASLQGNVLAVSGLASTSQKMVPQQVDGPKVVKVGAAAVAARIKGRSATKAPPPDAFVNAKPCSTYYGQKIATSVPSAYGKQQPYVPCGYVPSQLEGAYGLSGAISHGIDGKGVTVAITDAYAAPTILADANTYAVKHGQKAFAKGQFSQVLPSSFQYGYDDAYNGDQCGEQGWYGEETLDVEAVHALAPGAKVKYVASKSCDNGDFLDTLNKVIDNHLADIVTDSWGGTDETNGSAELDAAYQQAFQQAAMTGIGIYFSAGDSGDGASANNGVPVAEAPANSDLVTAVGGTSIAISKSNKRIWETGWSTSKSVLTDGAWAPTPPGTYVYGGGGGTSQVFTQPWYQKGVVPAVFSKRYSSTPGRVVPDVSAIGDPNTGFLVGETQTFPDGSVKYGEYRIGGTSLASPVFAGIMAIADQVAHHPHGFANPALYRAYGSPAYYDDKPLAGTAVVRVDYANTVDDTDGTVTSLRTIDATDGTTIKVAKGYDDITGVGSVVGLPFLATLG